MKVDDIHELDARFPLGRVCEPEDVADAVRFWWRRGVEHHRAATRSRRRRIQVIASGPVAARTSTPRAPGEAMSGICEGRVVVITGAGRGIGRSHALEFARQGARVVVNDLGTAPDGGGASSGPAHDVVEEIRAMGGEAVANGDDASDWEGPDGSWVMRSTRSAESTPSSTTRGSFGTACWST